MANIKEIVGKIGSITSTQQITKAMKMVAASKLNKVQGKVAQTRAYSENLKSVVSSIISSGASSFPDEYTEQRKVQNILFVIMASDKGLCGSFNTNIMKYAIAEVKKTTSLYPEATAHILPIGEKVNAFFSKQDFKLIKDFVNAASIVSFEKASEVANFAKNSFTSGHYDKVVLIYSSFISIATQEAVTLDYLPIVFSKENLEMTVAVSSDFIYEPSQEKIMHILLPKLLEIQIYNAMLESSASEHSARMMTMNKATDNAGEMLKSLKITYNRTRQAAITQEISEIVSGAEALSK